MIPLLNKTYVIYIPRWDEIHTVFIWDIIGNDYVMNIESELGVVHGVLFNIKDFKEDCVVIDIL